MLCRLVWRGAGQGAGQLCWSGTRPAFSRTRTFPHWTRLPSGRCHASSWITSRSSAGDKGEFKTSNVRRAERRERRKQENSATALLASLNVDQEQEVVGESVGMKFVLKQVVEEITKLACCKEPLPFPDSITVNQWRELLSLTDRRARFRYLVSLTSGEHTYEEIQKYDDQFTQRLELPAELLEKAMAGRDREEREQGKIKVLKLLHELEQLRQNGHEVPPEIPLRTLKDVVSQDGHWGRNKFVTTINFLNTRLDEEMKDIRKKRCRQHIGPEFKQRHEEEVASNNHIVYGLGHNCNMLRLNETKVKQYFDWQVWREFIHGQPIVVDFSYLSKITHIRARRSMIRNEAAIALKNNKESIRPYAMHFTGVDSSTHSVMKEFFQIADDGSNFPVHITSQHQTELFDKERLVYLSPDSRTDLVYNEDDVYVIGGIIDRGEDRAPLTLAAAKKERIRHARFPLKNVMGLHADLNIETCVAIMTDYRASGDWFYAFRWIPPRLLGNRLKTSGHRLGMEEEHKLAFRAHSALSPVSGISTLVAERNKRLNNKQYRQLYTEIVKSTTYEQMEKIMNSLKC